MAFDKSQLANIDDSDPANYPLGQIRDNDGSDNGTPVSRLSMSDIFEFFTRALVLSGTAPNGEYDNVQNGYQYMDALLSLANKNNKQQALTAGNAVIASVSTPILILPVKIETLLTGEILIAKAAADYASQTKLKGSTANTYLTISSSDAYKANDYVLVIKTGSGVVITALITGGNLNTKVAAANFLKAATNSQELAGLLDTVASTPLGVLNAFMDRVIGSTSGSYLATHTRNGLLSMADKTALDALTSTRNRGWFSGVDPGGGAVGDSYPHSGDIISAIQTSFGSNPGAAFIQITMANAMDNTNYFVRVSLVSEGNIAFDNDCLAPVCRIDDATKFTFSIQEAYANVQNLKIHIEAVQL